MKSLLAFGVTAALFILSGCSMAHLRALAEAKYAHDAQSVQFADNEQDALILIRVEATDVPSLLHITEYDEKNRTLAHGTPSRNNMVPIGPSDTPRYMAKRMAPGSYAYSVLYHQTGWGACFQDDTRKFTVNAGEVVFLGDFQPAANFAQIEQLAVAHGDRTVSGPDPIIYYDHIIPPQITTPTATSADFIAAQSYEAASMPWLHGRLRPVVYQTATFQPGHDLILRPRCIEWP
jgi:hypothetical protein